MQPFGGGIIVARLGCFLPNLAVLGCIVQGKMGLGGSTVFGQVYLELNWFLKV